MASNPALAEAIGIAAGHVVAAISTLRGEETGGRLEIQLAETLSRSRWAAW